VLLFAVAAPTHKLVEQPHFLEENPAQFAWFPPLNLQRYFYQAVRAFCADAINLMSLQYSPSPTEQAIQGKITVARSNWPFVVPFNWLGPVRQIHSTLKENR
jgi:hypothetical protein